MDDPEPVLRIGKEEGPYPFARLIWARFLDSGGIVVPALGTGELRFFDSRLDRYTIVSTLTGGYRSSPDRVPGNFSVFGVLRNGGFLLFSPGRGFHPELPPGLQWVATDVVSVNPVDGAPHVIGSLPGRQQLVEANGDTGVIIPALYSVQTVGEDGFHWGTPDRFEIRYYDPQGRLLRIQRRTVEPTPVTPEINKEWLPFFEDPFVDYEPGLWVGAHSWPSDQGLVRHWSIFSPQGVWLGDAAAPERVRIVDCQGEQVLGIWLNEMDVPYVHIHRLIVD